MSEGFSFTEDQQAELVGTYEKVVVDMQKASTDFVENLLEACNASNYEPVLLFGNQCIQFYNEDLITGIQANFQEWLNGDGSISALAREMEAGQAAEQTAAQMESELEDALTSNIKPLDTMQVDVARPQETVEVFDKVSDILADYYKALEQIRDDANDTVQRLADENDTFGSLSVMIPGTVDGAISAFEAIVARSDEMSEHFNQKRNIVKNNQQTATQEMETKASEMEDTYTSGSYAPTFGV